MSFAITIPFHAFKLRLYPGVHFYMPMNDPNAIRLENTILKLASKYAEKLQSEVLNKGDFQQLLEEYRTGELTARNIQVTFPASKDGFTYPEFDFQTQVFIHLKNDSGWWGIVPTLGITAFGEDEPALMENLESAIRLDFVRKNRLNAVQEIVAAIWFESARLKKTELNLEIHSLGELENLSRKENENWLSRVAKPLKRFSGRQAYGYEKELRQLEEVLHNKFSRNALIIGPNGSGKTTLVWEAARSLKKHSIPGEIWETTASSLIKELTRETGWQHNLGFLCRELAQREDILFVKNLLTLFEVGKYEGNNVSMAEFLYPYLGRGEINLISECTEEELAQIELRAPMFTACFRIIRLEEPGKKVLEHIILNKVRDIAGGHQIDLEEEAVQETIRLTRRFNPYAGMPGQPIRFLESIILNGPGGPENRIDSPVVIRHFCESTGIPELMINPVLPFRIDQVEKDFENQVFGQAAAVKSVVEAVAAVKTALSRTGKPIASFLFLGPTGVGKTELAKELARFMFGDRKRLVRFDMSEFGNYHNVLRLAGAHASSEGLLTSAVRKQPFCVLLFDEVEKAHPAFFDLLLQILGEGRLTDSSGKTANFCSSIIIMTSNIGADKQNQNPISWDRSVTPDQVAAIFTRSAEQFFKPELFNRIDKIIPFLPIGKQVCRQIAEREIRLFYQREGIRFRRLELSIQPEALDWLADQGFDPKFGARRLQRVIRSNLILPLAGQLNLYDAEELLSVSVFMDESGRLQFDLSSDSDNLETWIEELEKQNFAEYASNLRRKMAALKAAPLYIQFKRDLDELEMQKSKDPLRFWQDPRRTAWYNTLLRIEQEADSLQQEIFEKEEIQGLACLGLGDYLPDAEGVLGDWKKRFFAFQQKLFSTIYVEENYCYLGVFGKDPEPIFNFYKQLFRTKKFDFNCQSVWFDPRYFEQQAKINDENAVAGGERKSEYLLSDLTEDEKVLFQPPTPLSQLFGFVFFLKSPCVWVYCRTEGGIQEWPLPDLQPARFLVVTSLTGVKPPSNIHRKDFYQKDNPRRVISASGMADKLLPISGQCKSEERLEKLVYELDILFEKTLETEIFKAD